VLQALACQALGNEDQAGKHLQEAIESAAPERYVRLFLDEGAPLKDLLRRVVAGASPGVVQAYGSVLLAAFGEGHVASE
jgi:LuxR family maltose regulon positive regulatory protein